MWSGSAVSERGRMMPVKAPRDVLISTSLQTMAPKLLSTSRASPR